MTFFWPGTGDSSGEPPDGDDSGRSDEQHANIQLALESIARDLGGTDGPKLDALIDAEGPPPQQLVTLLQKAIDTQHTWLCDDFSEGKDRQKRFFAAKDAYNDALERLRTYVGAQG